MTVIDYGKVAYDAYRTQAGGQSLVSGARLPDWDWLNLEIQAAWRAAANAVLDAPYQHPETSPQG